MADEDFHYGSVAQYLKNISELAGIEPEEEVREPQKSESPPRTLAEKPLSEEKPSKFTYSDAETSSASNIFQSAMSTKSGLTHGKILKLVNLPPDCAEYEAMSICVPFGTMQKFQIDTPKREAFVEFESIESARKMVEYSSKGQLKLVNYQVYITETDQTALYIPVDHEPILRTLLGHIKYTNPSKTLHFIVNGLSIPVTLEDVHFLFSLCGVVVRIVLFTTSDKPQSLIEMQCVEQAIATKFYLDQKPFFTGCGQMVVSFSKNQELQITGKNTNSSRDYTAFPATEDIELITYDEGKKLEIIRLTQPANNQSYNLNTVPSQNQQFSQYMQPIGGPAPSMISHDKSYFQMSQPYAQNSIQSGNMNNSQPQVDYASSPVIVVSGIPSGFTLKDLKNIYLNYGNITKLKTLFTRQNTYMVEFTDPLFAEVAVKITDKVKLGDTIIKANRTRHAQLIVKLTDNPDEALYLLVEESEHRFTNADPEILANMQPPCNCLGITGFPFGYSEDDLRDLFESHGYEICTIVSFMNELIYIVTFGSTLIATKAMGSLNNLKPEGFTVPLRIVYSRIR